MTRYTQTSADQVESEMIFVHDILQIIFAIGMFACVFPGMYEISKKGRWQVLLFWVAVMLVLRSIILSSII